MHCATVASELMDIEKLRKSAVAELSNSKAKACETSNAKINAYIRSAQEEMQHRSLHPDLYLEPDNFNFENCRKRPMTQFLATISPSKRSKKART